MATAKVMFQGASATATDSNGSQIITAVEEYAISGISAQSHAEAVKQALSASGLPKIRQAHPRFDANVNTITLKEMLSDWRAVVTVTYQTQTDDNSGGGGGGGNQATLSTGARYETVLSYRGVKIDGTLDELIEVEYQLAPTGGNSTGDKDKQKGEVGIFRARPFITLTRIEEEDALVKSTEYVGFTNKGTWLEDYPAELNEPDSWLCTNIISTTADGGKTWRVSYEFMYRKELWHEMAVYIISETGLPPVDAKAPVDNIPGAKGQGTLIVRVAGQADFNELEISIKKGG